MWGISWLAANQSAAQEGLCTVEWVSKYYRRVTTTCFGPICGPSSGCDWTIGSVIQECVDRSWGFLGEGGRSRSHYSSGYHGPVAMVPTYRAPKPRSVPEMPASFREIGPTVRRFSWGSRIDLCNYRHRNLIYQIILWKYHTFSDHQ